MTFSTDVTPTQIHDQIEAREDVIWIIELAVGEDIDLGSEQKILQFSNEDVPVSLGLVFDSSGSMSNKMEKSRSAVLQFFKTANPQDEFFLVDFSDAPRLLSDFTTSIEDVQNRLVFTQAKGRTALLDALYLALNHMRHAKHAKKAILVISDGGDNVWVSAGFRDFYCRACDRSLSVYDQRHRLVANFTYDLPLGRGKALGSSWNKALDAILGQWQINGIA